MASLTTRVRYRQHQGSARVSLESILREMKWESNPAVVGGFVYVSSYDDYLYCLNATTGVQVWNFNTGEFIYSSPAVAGGCVTWGARTRSWYCLNATTGALIWNFTTGGAVRSSPAVADGRVDVGSMDYKCVPLGRNHGGADLELQHGTFSRNPPPPRWAVRVCWN